MRKIHNVILMPSIDAADALATKLEAIGNLHSDGRPILGLDSRDLLEITLETCPEALFIPAHIWTPHFSLFGAYSGFDCIEDCFEDLTPHIYALETGLSSDPAMNFRISALDQYTLVSNSDAHSPAKLAREANLLNCEMSYPALTAALRDRAGDAFAGTIEFFPEEGKYHYDGHRNCNVVLSPEETKRLQHICPVCGGKITLGVSYRVEELADRPLGQLPYNPRPFESLIPLAEIIAAANGVASVSSVKVQRQYDHLLRAVGPELFILREAGLDTLSAHAGPFVAEGIRRLRNKQVEIRPGYDGEYGKISLFTPEDLAAISGQTSLFGNLKPQESKKKTAPALQAAEHREASIPEEKTTDAPGKQDDSRYGLSDAQWQAASAPMGVTAVIAGPGSGKTRTLVSRILYLVERCGVAPEHITAVTFTNKAAAEMRERLEARFADKKIVRAMHIGTFHSICLQLLRDWCEAPLLIDEYEARSLAGECARSMGLNYTAKEALFAISVRKNGQNEPPSERNEALYELYTQKLADYGVCDFDDLLLTVLQHFEEETEPPAKEQFRHLLVDEFQDSNETQYRLIRTWQKHGESLFVIGDPDQSIYGFRGADPRCFTNLTADTPQLNLVELKENYRSSPEIVAAATAVIGGQNGDRRMQPMQKSQEKVQVLQTRDAFEEAQTIAKTIAALVGGVDMLQAHAKKKSTEAARGFSEMAVLYRTNRQAEIIERCLTEEGIPCRIAGREDFLETDEIRDALAFFRFLTTPEDLISLRRSLSCFGVPKEISEKLQRNYQKNHKNLAALTKLCAGTKEEHVQEFLATVKEFATRVRKDKPEKIITGWIDLHYLGGNPAMQHLQEIALLHKDMNSFLSTLLLGEERDIQRNGGKRYVSDAVLLSTLHGAKGLEFPVVFLAGFKDGLLPFKQSDGACDLEEERRLAYVGMTRAEHSLYLLTSDPPSPFYRAIPEVWLELSKEKKRRPAGKQLSLF